MQVAKPLLKQPEDIDLPLPSLEGIEWGHVYRLLEGEVHESYFATVERHVRVQIARGVDGVAHFTLRSVLADGRRTQREVGQLVSAVRPFVLDVLRSASRLRVRHRTHVARSRALSVELLRKVRTLHGTPNLMHVHRIQYFKLL